MNDQSFLIAGGGIAGLAASLALADIKKRVEVFERAASFEETGAGLQMSPNAVHCLRWLGVWEAVESVCVAPSEIHFRDGRSGAFLQRIGLGKPFAERFGAPYTVVRRADLLRVLMEAAQSYPLVALHAGNAVASAENMGEGTRLHFTEGSSARGAAVIAADGIRSTIRAGILHDGEPALSGQVIYRALLPFEKVPLSTVADCVTLWMYPAGHVVHYPVSQRRQFNIVAALDGSLPDDGWSEPANPAEVANGFRQAANSLGELLAAVPGWTKFAAADRPPAPHWTEGRIALIGDAAHPSLPYLAQGAAMALEDAVILARCLERNAEVPAAFLEYARLRQPRTARIQLKARQLGSLYHARGVFALARNAALKTLGPQFALDRNQWIYKWQP